MKPFVKIMWRRRKDAGLTRIGVNLNSVIAPMLDLSFLLLSFFLINYHPISFEGHLDGTLLPPEEEPETKGKKKKDKMLVDEKLDLDQTIKVVLESVENGKSKEKIIKVNDVAVPLVIGPGHIFRIRLITPDSPEGEDVYDFAKDAKTAKPFYGGLLALKKRLEEFLADPIVDSSKLKIKADGNTKHIFVVQVYDFCKLARAMVADPEDENRKKLRQFDNINLISPFSLQAELKK